MPALTDNARGAVFMTLSMAGFAFNDGLMKAVMADTPLFQAVFMRGAMATALLVAVAASQGAFARRFAISDRPALLGRSLGEIGATVCFLTALFHMPIADATAILQATPLTVTLAAAVFLGAPVGWRRWTAILVGLGGVMLIVRPGGAGFDANALWAVAAVGFVTLRDVSTRFFSAGAPSILVALVTSGAITVVAGLLASSGAWEALDLGRWLRLVGAAGFLVVGYLFGVMSMRVGEIAVVSPFRYTVLIWALLIGAFVFGDLPDWLTLTGAAIVVGSGVYTLWRERRIAAAARLSPPRPRGA
ncbi:MAG: DMT family transporter [Rhodobacteraceae bacterium]|nr:MAG: DMT family transporter [Paracoccaceae bacterium]